MNEDVTCEYGSEPQTVDHLLRCPLLEQILLNSMTEQKAVFSFG